MKTSPHITPKDFGKEPFRIFFPAGVLAGIIGVALWPLYFWGVTEFYPGQIHARIMMAGWFGGFIFGFLGTAMPRMLSANPFRLVEVVPLVVLHLAMVFSFAVGKVFWGDALFLALLAGLFACIAIRARKRKDTPPPGFVLVGLALLCVLAGAILAVIQNFRELDMFWITLQRLLTYQGFVLLPILGIGPFILPRFFGMPNKHDFPEMLVPSKDWMKKAILALAVGVVIIGSFVMEAKGWHRAAHGIRFAATLVYLYLEMPFHRAPKANNALGLSIRLAFLGVLAGFLTVAFFPEYRVTLLHLTLVGGFAIVTLVVATRVVFGHSGNIELLKGRNRWLLIAVGMMLFGMATRMSGDFWPKGHAIALHLRRDSVDRRRLTLVRLCSSKSSGRGKRRLDYLARINFRKGRANLLVCPESRQRFPTFSEIPYFSEIYFGCQYRSGLKRALLSFEEFSLSLCAGRLSSPR